MTGYCPHCKWCDKERGENSLRCKHDPPTPFSTDYGFKSVFPYVEVTDFCSKFEPREEKL